MGKTGSDAALPGSTSPGASSLENTKVLCAHAEFTYLLQPLTPFLSMHPKSNACLRRARHINENMHSNICKGPKLDTD